MDAKSSKTKGNMYLMLYKDYIQHKVYSKLGMQCEHGIENSVNPAQHINSLKKKSTGSLAFSFIR